MSTPRWNVRTPVLLLLFGFSSLTIPAPDANMEVVRRASSWPASAIGASNYLYPAGACATRRPGRMRDYVMTTIALEQERLLVAERILHEIERRHGLPFSDHPDLQPAVIDRFLVAYLPETRDGEPAPNTVEYAFTNSISDAIELLRRVVDETPDGWGSAAYVHDLDTGAGSH